MTDDDKIIALIQRFETDAVKYHPEISPYSQAVIYVAKREQTNPVIKDGYWCLGDIGEVFLSIKKKQDTRKHKPILWVRLDSYNEVCIQLKEK